MEKNMNSQISSTKLEIGVDVDATSQWFRLLSRGNPFVVAMKWGFKVIEWLLPGNLKLIKLVEVPHQSGVAAGKSEAFSVEFLEVLSWLSSTSSQRVHLNSLLTAAEEKQPQGWMQSLVLGLLFADCYLGMNRRTRWLTCWAPGRLWQERLELSSFRRVINQQC